MHSSSLICEQILSFISYIAPPFLHLLHLLADLLVALRGDEHLDTGLVHVVDVGPVGLDLGVFDPTCQAVDGPRRPGGHRCKRQHFWNTK